MKLIDRSRHEQWWNCPSLRYWQYDYNGTGLDFGTGLEAEIGTAVHEGIARLLCGMSEDDAAKAASTLEDATHQWVAEGLIRAYSRTHLQSLLSEWKVAQLEGEPLVEKDWIWCPSPELGVMIKLDGVLEHRATGAIRILEHKTSKWVERKEWQDKWAHNLQVWMEVASLEALVGKPVESVEITGLVVGQTRIDKQWGAILWGPLTVGYKKGEQWSSKYVAGWEKVRLQEAFPTPLACVEMLAANGLLENVIVPVPVIPPPSPVLKTFVEQMVNVELNMVPLSKDLQNLTHCMQWGRQCGAFDLCFHGANPDDYSPRVPHHVLDVTTTST